MEERSLSGRADVLDVMVELLAEIGPDPRERGQGELYDRLCEAVCRLTPMTRSVLLLYNAALRRVAAVGLHNLDRDYLDELYGNLEDTPIAQRALSADRVEEAHGADVAGQLPSRYPELTNGESIACVPVATGERWLGVIVADRAGEAFELGPGDRQAMWTLGRLAALAASAEMALSQRERGRVLAQRIDLAREIHERVVQRLFGVSLALGAEHDLSPQERRRCAEEMRSALADLRTVLARPLSRPAPAGDVSLRAELDRLRRHYTDPPVTVDWATGVEPPEGVDRLATSVVAEALRNAVKHAEVTRLDVTVAERDGAFALEVRNDGAGARSPTAGAGMGLRLAAMEALECGGVVEFGPLPGGEWRVRLLVPLAGEPAA